MRNDRYLNQSSFRAQQ